MNISGDRYNDGKNLTALPMEKDVPPVQQHNSAIASNQFQSGNIQSDGHDYKFKITGFNPKL